MKPETKTTRNPQSYKLSYVNEFLHVDKLSHLDLLFPK
jgi:hypothetical protein